jgi:4-hydroxy-tetrahydrodipicolinate synthase
MASDKKERVSMTKFGRLITAMVTPFDKDGSVDYAQAKALALALLKSGSEGLVLCGSTGESSTLTNDEKLRLFSDVKSVVGDRGSVIGNTGNNDTADSRDLSKAAEKTGIDGLMLVVPYYNRPSQEGLIQHFATIADATRLPCIIYNVPSRTVVNMTAETVLKLSKIKNIVGVKEASSNFDQISRIIQNAPADFLVYSGNDGDTLPVLALGGYGVISVVSHLVGEQMQQMMSCFRGGVVGEAADIHRRLMPLMNSMFIVSNPVPIKYALNTVGFRVGKPRLPLVEPDESSAKLIRDTLKDFRIDLPV